MDKHTRAHFAPGGGNNDAMKARPLHTMEGVGFVHLVDNAHRRQQHTRANAPITPRGEFEIGLLNSKLARAAAGRHPRVLDFRFREKSDPVIELMVQVNDETVHVEYTLARTFRLVVMHFAISADTGAAFLRMQRRADGDTEDCDENVTCDHVNSCEVTNLDLV